MQNLLNIDGYQAVIAYDPEINLFRGEFINLNGGADFYAETVDELHREARQSLKTFLDVCREQGIEPVRRYSGKFNVRIKPELHAAAVAAAAAAGISLNEWVSQAIGKSARAG